MMIVYFFIQVTDDLTELAGTIAGPPDTPYAGGKFRSVITAAYF